MPQNSNNPKIRKSKSSSSPHRTWLSLSSLKNLVVVRESKVVDSAGKKGKGDRLSFELLKMPQGKFIHGLKLPQWRNSSSEQRVTTFMSALLALRSYTTVAITVNLSPSTENAIRKQGNLNYPRDIITKVLRQHLPKGDPVLFFIVAEESPSGRLHLHGAIGVPPSTDCTKVIDGLSKGITQALAKNYRQRFKNTAVELKTRYHKEDVYLDREDNVRTRVIGADIDMRWSSYCLKTFNDPMRPAPLKKNIAASSDLRLVSSKVWDIARSVYSGKALFMRAAAQVRTILDRLAAAPRNAVSNLAKSCRTQLNISTSLLRSAFNQGIRSLGKARRWRLSLSRPPSGDGPG